MSAPNFSIITLTRNRAPLLEQNFSSLMGQMGPHDEIIVIDNGSTDTTKSVIQRFMKKLPIKVRYNAKGSYPALYNLGIRRAKNEIIVFLDDDCIASPTFMKQLRVAHSARSNSVIQGMTLSIPAGNIYAEIMGDHYTAFLTANTLPDGSLRIFDNKNASLPRSLLKTVGGFDESMILGSEDIELGIRLRRKGIPILLDKTIIAYHHERTTFQSFIAQHMRFARSEGHLDKRVQVNDRLGVTGEKKLKAQTRSAIRRECRYIRNGELMHSIQLPFLYLILATVRIWGYATSQ